MASTAAQAYIGSGAEPPARVQGAEPPVGFKGSEAPEAESSVAFEAPVE